MARDIAMGRYIHPPGPPAVSVAAAFRFPPPTRNECNCSFRGREAFYAVLSTAIRSDKAVNRRGAARGQLMTIENNEQEDQQGIMWYLPRY
jgi:hypothetical protein